MDEIDNPGGEEVLDTGDGGEETTDTTEEQPGAPAGGGPTPPGRPAAPARSFSQEQVNRFIADERKRWEATASRRVAPPVRPNPAAGATPREFDAETKAALDAMLEERLAPVRAIEAKTEINDAFSNFGELHPEFLTKATRETVVNAILELGPDVVQKTPMSVLLDYGWLKTQWGGFDKEAFRKQSIADHLAGKGAQARSTGQPQGAGGKATTNPKPRGKDWKDADAAMKQLIDEERAAQ